jgi:hypothetical protein
MMKKQFPVSTATVKADQVVALPCTSSTVAEAIAMLSAELQQAIAQMDADDISLECNANRGAELHIRLRAYRHRKESAVGDAGKR